jgi:hypothetical protein
LTVVHSPADGEACGGRLVVMGDFPRPPLGQRALRALHAAPLPRRLRAWAERHVEPSPLPEVYLDGELVARAADIGSSDGTRWAMVMDAPFVTPGSHRLTIAAPTPTREIWSERRLQFADLDDALPVVATTTLTLHVDLDSPEPAPRLSIAGRERRLLAWLCGTYADAWRGFAVVDVADLSPGTYSAELTLAHHPARHVWFERIAVGPL